MKIICISGKAGHGKDTVANMMKSFYESNNKKVLILHFADLLKYICRIFLNWNGKKNRYGRYLLQYIGTDVFRKQSPDYWANFVISCITFLQNSKFENKWDYIIIPDTRFPNEYELFKHYKLDACLVRVIREGKSCLAKSNQNHISETALDNYKCDYYIHNNGNLEVLKNTSETVANIIERSCKENFYEK